MQARVIAGVREPTTAFGIYEDADEEQTHKNSGEQFAY